MESDVEFGLKGVAIAVAVVVNAGAAFFWGGSTHSRINKLEQTTEKNSDDIDDLKKINTTVAVISETLKTNNKRINDIHNHIFKGK